MNWKSKNQKQVRKCFPKAVLYILPSRKMENSIPPWPMWAQTSLVNCFAFSELIFECLCFSSALQLTSPKAKRMALHLEKENHCQKDKINSNKPFEVLVLMNHRGLKKKCICGLNEYPQGPLSPYEWTPRERQVNLGNAQLKASDHFSVCLQGWAYWSFFFPSLAS